MQQLILAVLLGFIVALVLGPVVIPMLKRLKFGQTEREDGPQSHLVKSGTPTMGGIMFIIGAGVVVFVLGWGQMLKGEFSQSSGRSG